MLELLISTLATGALCTVWVLWQRLADRLDPGTCSDRRAGGRCSVPEIERPGSCSECNDCG